MSAGMGWDHPGHDDVDSGPARVAATVGLLVVLLAGAIAWAWLAPVVPPAVGMCP